MLIFYHQISSKRSNLTIKKWKYNISKAVLYYFSTVLTFLTAICAIKSIWSLILPRYANPEFSDACFKIVFVLVRVMFAPSVNMLLFKVKLVNWATLVISMYKSGVVVGW